MTVSSRPRHPHPRSLQTVTGNSAHGGGPRSPRKGPCVPLSPLKARAQEPRRQGGWGAGPALGPQPQGLCTCSPSTVALTLQQGLRRVCLGRRCMNARGNKSKGGMGRVPRAPHLSPTWDNFAGPRPRSVLVGCRVGTGRPWGPPWRRQAGSLHSEELAPVSWLGGPSFSSRASSQSPSPFSSSLTAPTSSSLWLWRQEGSRTPHLIKELRGPGLGDFPRTSAPRALVVPTPTEAVLRPRQVRTLAPCQPDRRAGAWPARSLGLGTVGE